MEKVTSDFQQAEQACQEAQEQVAVARRKREEAVAQMELIRSKRETARREGEGARARANAEELTTRQRSEALEKIRLEISAKDIEEQRDRSGFRGAFPQVGRGRSPIS